MHVEVYLVGTDVEDALNRGPIMSRRQAFILRQPASHGDPLLNVYTVMMEARLDSVFRVG